MRGACSAAGLLAIDLRRRNLMCLVLTTERVLLLMLIYSWLLWLISRARIMPLWTEVGLAGLQC